MHGMLCIRVGRGLVGKGHEAREGVSLTVGRYVGPDVHVDQSKDVVTESDNVVGGAGFISLGGIRLPAESKDVNEHGAPPEQSSANSGQLTVNRNRWHMCNQF